MRLLLQKKKKNYETVDGIEVLPAVQGIIFWSPTTVKAKQLAVGANPRTSMYLKEQHMKARAKQKHARIRTRKKEHK